jgi:alpha-ribazole phosphatase
MILVRHPTPVGAAGLCYGRLDLDLPADWTGEADAVAASLPPGRWRVVSSPARRCRLLAERLAGGPVEIEPRFAELDFGTWEGRRWDAIPRAELDPWSADFVTRRPPGGESFAELAERARSAAAEIAARPDAERTLVVSHSGVIRALLAGARGVALADAFSIAVPFASLHTL